MNRLKLLAVAMLLAVPVISACGEDPIPPPPTGTIAGKVAIEGDGADGVTVALSSGVTVTTANGGAFSFADVVAETYTVTISNYPEDASFQQTSATATLSEEGETVTVNFNGSYIRTSAIMGTVTVENDGLRNITVKITGISESETLTGATGQYAFTGLRAGNYTIEISGFDDEDIGFGATSSTAQVAVGESKVVPFEGTYLRTSAIMGQVSIEGNGLGGVTVSLQGKGEQWEETTNGAGQFMFDDLRKGDYAIGISGYDADEYGFDATSKNVAVPYGETANVPFEGIALRTAGVKGTVTIEGMGPLDGVTVSLAGKGEDKSVVTNGAGQWAFDRLHAGDYAIGISGYDTDEYGFDVTSENVTVALKETATVEFGGIMLRTAGITGGVTVKGDALPGVTVTVTGGPKDEEHTATTNGAGIYDVGELHAGDYSVAISGYDTQEYGFEVTTKSVSVGLRETADVAFAGILLRTAGISGRVTVDGEPMSGLTVALSGEEDRPGKKTNSDGQFAFSGLAAGDYKLTLSGYKTGEYEFDASMDITLELDEAAIANFEGRSLRTVAVMGTVSAEGDGIAGVSVTLVKVLGPNSGEVLGAMMTDTTGGYIFDELLAATYRVDISGFDDEYDFATTTRIGSVATDSTAMWNFDADVIRTASVSGMVTVDGDGMGDIMVMLTGDHGTEMDTVTASDGSYMFEGLRKGGYTVSIMNPDEDMYDFPATSRSVSLSVGQAQEDISFAGSMLRRASISGQVHIEGDGLEGVMVTLDGDAEDEAMTDGNGEYNFPGLAGGDYEVEIENPDEVAYTFEVMEVDVDDLGDEEAEIVDFAGKHTTTASVSGMMFLDEIVNDSVHTEGEPVFEASIPLIMNGPGIHDVTVGMSDSTGMYSFEGLKAGSYRVLANVTDSVKAVLAKYGYRFIGEATGQVVNVPAADTVTVNFAFRITKQTIYGGALLANEASASFAVGGVTMALYPTAEDADDGTNSLGSATTRSGEVDDPNTGFAKFDFDRAKDKGPGGGPIDYLVYAKVTGVSNSDLVVHDDGLIEIEYEAVDRTSLAPAAVKLINTRVNFQWWVKSNEDAKDGNEFLANWEAKNGVATDANGRGRYTGTLTAAQRASVIAARPVPFTVALDTDQADSVDMTELWTQSRSLTHTHTGLENPATNTYDANNLGLIHVTWRTHSMVLGVYREADDVEGYTDFQSRLPGGDHRPASGVERDMEIALMAYNSRDRLDTYKYDHDACTNEDSDETDDRAANVTLRGGLAKVSCLPVNDEFTIKFDLGDDRAEVGPVEVLGGYIEPYNERDMSISGTTVGTFGDGSGGVPEVRICLSSEGTTDDECATWGYQWTTGSVVGNVGDQSGHKVTVAPTTENHGAEADTTNSRSAGAYELDELRDGVYDITAHDKTTYKVSAPVTRMVSVYHDETTDDGDTLTDYVGTAAQDTARWRTQRLGLKLMGYIGNDVNNDRRFRGDEAVAGISVRLSGGGLSMTTTTDERGHYKFQNLPAGRYTITPTQGAYEIARGYSSSGSRHGTQSSKQADEYPALTEGEFNLPRWTSYTSRSLSNSSVRVCDDGEEPCATLYNFGLLYKDGEVEGGVNNLSGSASGIDLVFTDVFTDHEQEFNTNFRGEFKRSRLTEGDFRVVIEDAGWAVPKMRGSVPDDDGTATAPTTVTGSVRGKDDFVTMDMLHVYDAGASSGDAASSSVRVRGRMQGTTAANYDSAVSWRTGWDREPRTEETEGGNIGTISWKSESVSFFFGFRNSALSSDASVEVKKGSGVCASHRCVLDDNTTGRRDSTEVEETTLTVMVTAENGYDDHEYSLKVGRAAPIGRYKESTDIKVLKSNGTDSTVTAKGDPGTSLSTAWTLETKSSSSSSVNVRIDLETLGDPEEDNAYCAQTVHKVTRYNDTTTIEALNPPDEDNYEDDICRNTRYRLSAATQGTLYELDIRSEDSVSETYYLEVSRAGPRLSDDATLGSLAVEPGNMSPAFDAETTEYTVNVTHEVEEITATWSENDGEATSEADPVDADADTTGHQLELGAKGSDTDLTITVTAEDGTELEYTITVRRPEEPVTDDATLSNLTIGEGTLTPPFDPDITEYTVGVAYTIEEVTAGWDEAHDEATSEGDPADADDATDGHQIELGDKGSETTLTITVTAADGSTTEDYTVTVTRLFNDDATLSDLTVDPGTLDPAFDGADTLSVYTSDVAFDVDEVTVAWELSDTNATAAANLGDDDPDTEGHQIGLEDEGDTTDIAITVTAENGDSTRVYTLKVYRAQGPPEDDATLSDLTVDHGELGPSFRPDEDTYDVKVTHDIEEIVITWTLADPNASTDLETPYTLELNGAGDETDFSVTVTAEDETTTETYTITVLRATAPGFVLKRGGTVVTEFTIDEGDTAIYSVELATEPDTDETVTVNLDAGDGITIDLGSSLTFTDSDWDTPQNVEMSSIKDDNAQQEDPVEIRHTGSSGDSDYHDLADTLAVTLKEIHTKGVTLSSTGIEFVEGGSNTYTVVLNSQPTGDVVVSISGTRHGITVNAGSSELLEFTTGNWQTTQNVAVALAENTDTADYPAFDLTHRVVGADYDGLEVDDTRVKAMDDESPSVVVSRTEWSMDEGAEQIYNIQLTQVPDADEEVTVRLIYNSGHFSVAYAGGGTAAVLDVDNWDAGINVTVTAVDVTADVTRTLRHTVSSAGGEDSEDEGDDGPKYPGKSASDIAITVKDMPDDS